MLKSHNPYNVLSEIISFENVQQMGEMIALKTLRGRYAYARYALEWLYVGLVKDLNRSNDNRHILIEQTKDRITLKREDIIEFLTTAIQEKPQQMLDLLIKQIVFYDDKIEITYNYTDKGRPDDEHQAFSFYTDSVTWITKPYHFGKEVTTTMTFELFI